MVLHTFARILPDTLGSGMVSLLLLSSSSVGYVTSQEWQRSTEMTGAPAQQGDASATASWTVIACQLTAARLQVWLALTTQHVLNHV